MHSSDFDLLQSFFLYSPDAMLLIDSRGIILEANPAACDLFATDYEILLKQSLSAYLFDDENNPFLPEQMDPAEQPMKNPAVFFLLQPDQSKRGVDLKLVQLSPGRSILYMKEGNFHEELEYHRRKHEQYQFAINGSNDGIWDWDLTTNQVYFSARWKEILGYEESELPNSYQTFDENLHPDDREHVSRALNEYFLGKEKRYEIEFRMKHKDGSYRWISGRGEAIRDRSGKPIRVAGSHTDITDRIDQQNNLEEMRKQADRANQVKSDFLATMSHEVLTPLNGIIGFTQLLNEMNPSEEASEYIRIIQSSSQSLLRMIHDILDFSRLDQGKIFLVYETFPFRDLINHINNLVQPVSESKRLSFDLTLDPELPEHIITDFRRLKQVVTGILDNAIKFTPDGQITMDISGTPAANTENSMELTFTIKDTGIGIPGEFQKQIFESFTQADSALNRAYDGTGLGLSICNHLLKLFGSELHFESVPNQGSTFWFTIEVEKNGEASKPNMGLPNLPLSMDHFTILIVEDIITNMTLLTRMIEKLLPGAQILQASDGRKGIELFQEHSPAMVFMDLHMPDLNGFETTAMIRNLENRSGKDRTPIIAITADTASCENRNCLKEGIDDYLAKPIQLTDLARCLMSQLRPGS